MKQGRISHLGLREDDEVLGGVQGGVFCAVDAGGETGGWHTLQFSNYKLQVACA